VSSFVPRGSSQRVIGEIQRSACSNTMFDIISRASSKSCHFQVENDLQWMWLVSNFSGRHTDKWGRRSSQFALHCGEHISGETRTLFVSWSDLPKSIHPSQLVVLVVAPSWLLYNSTRSLHSAQLSPLPRSNRLNGWMLPRS
jgi:hypothetical protein